jgi:hypothetical protein
LKIQFLSLLAGFLLLSSISALAQTAVVHRYSGTIVDVDGFGILDHSQRYHTTVKIDFSGVDSDKLVLEDLRIQSDTDVATMADVKSFRWHKFYSVLVVKAGQFTLVVDLRNKTVRHAFDWLDPIYEPANLRLEVEPTMSYRPSTNIYYKLGDTLPTLR